MDGVSHEINNTQHRHTHTQTHTVHIGYKFGMGKQEKNKKPNNRYLCAKTPHWGTWNERHCQQNRLGFVCVKMLKRTGLNENNVPPSGLVRRGEICLFF